jgi:hypothetical protein
MPIPQPRPEEEKEAFLQRCMADGTMLLDFPDPSQRYAICEQQAERNEMKAKDVEKVTKQR